jgi:hypothetical protein
MPPMYHSKEDNNACTSYEYCTRTARFMSGVFHDHPLTAGLGFNHTTGYVHIAWSRASTYHLIATFSFLVSRICWLRLLLTTYLSQYDRLRMLKLSPLAQCPLKRRSPNLFPRVMVDDPSNNQGLVYSYLYQPGKLDYSPSGTCLTCVLI